MAYQLRSVLAGAVLAAGLVLAAGEGQAMPVTNIGPAASGAAASVEKVWCCRYGWRRPFYGYGWRRPFIGYGYGWRRPYGYGWGGPYGYRYGWGGRYSRYGRNHVLGSYAR